MSQQGNNPKDVKAVFVPAARIRALTHSLVWLVPAFVIFTFSWTIIFGQGTLRLWQALDTVSVAMMLVVVPFNLLALGLAIWGLRWLLLALWPGRAGVDARRDELVLAFGPFGTHRYPVADLDVRYLFELDEEGEEEGFEAFLPEEEQIQSYLPRIKYPKSSEPLNREILKFVAGPEPRVARALRPMVAQWRGENAGKDAEPGQ